MVNQNLCVLITCRSSRSQMFFKIGALKNFAKFKGKLLCRSLFFNKVSGVRLVILLKMILRQRRFPVNYAEFFRTHFSVEHLQWLFHNLNNLRRTLTYISLLTETAVRRYYAGVFLQFFSVYYVEETALADCLYIK